METTIIILIINIESFISGWLLTENKYLTIAHISKKFDKKPFNCRPCLTFHLVWIQSGIYAIIEKSYPIFIIGITLAFIIFGFLYLRNKSKIIK